MAATVMPFWPKNRADFLEQIAWRGRRCYPFQVGYSKLKYQRLAVAPSQRRFAQAHAIVCCGASIVAHFARKVRGTNLVAAKHELKIQQSHAPERWSCSLRVRGPHFASKVSYSASPQTSAKCPRGALMEYFEGK